MMCIDALLQFCVSVEGVRRALSSSKQLDFSTLSGSCHHSGPSPQVLIGGGLQIWRVTENILKRHLQISENG